MSRHSPATAGSTALIWTRVCQDKNSKPDAGRVRFIRRKTHFVGLRDRHGKPLSSADFYLRRLGVRKIIDLKQQIHCWSPNAAALVPEGI